MKYWLIAMACSLLLVACSQNKTEEKQQGETGPQPFNYTCEDFRTGTFIYPNLPYAEVIRYDTFQVEKKYDIDEEVYFSIDWKDSCRYTLTYMYSKPPGNYGMQIGDTISVELINIKRDTFEYQAIFWFASHSQTFQMIKKQ